jgi:hypothetical protein
VKPQLFILGDDVLKTLTKEEFEATVRDMLTMELFEPPFRALDLQVSRTGLDLLAASFAGAEKGYSTGLVARIWFDEKDSEGVTPFRFRLKKDGGGPNAWYDARTLAASNRPPDETDERFEEVVRCFGILVSDLVAVLIVLLATKNVQKTVKENKLAKLGIGKNPYTHTTTLSIGKVTERTDGVKGDEPRGEVRPHLRRGHIRNQHYGPNNQFKKQIFVQPVFVNADKGWVAERTAYNVRRAA